MAESIRERLMQAIEAQLKTITTANGYNNTFAVVSRFTQQPLDFTKIPILLVSQGPEVSDPTPNQAVTRALPVRIRLIHRHDPVAEKKTSEQVLNSLQQDIHKALFEDHTHGGLALFTNPAPREVSSEDGEGMGETDTQLEHIGKTLEYTVTYRHHWQDESVAA